MVKVIFWQYFVFDPIFFLHLRDITSLLWRSWFNLEIYVQWSEVGRPAWRLDIILFLGKKSFDTIIRTHGFIPGLSSWMYWIYHIFVIQQQYINSVPPSDPLTYDWLTYKKRALNPSPVVSLLAMIPVAFAS